MNKALIIFLVLLCAGYTDSTDAQRVQDPKVRDPKNSVEYHSRAREAKAKIERMEAERDLMRRGHSEKSAEGWVYLMESRKDIKEYEKVLHAMANSELIRNAGELAYRIRQDNLLASRSGKSVGLFFLKCVCHISEHSLVSPTVSAHARLIADKTETERGLEVINFVGSLIVKDHSVYKEHGCIWDQERRRGHIELRDIKEEGGNPCFDSPRAKCIDENHPDTSH